MISSFSATSLIHCRSSGPCHCPLELRDLSLFLGQLALLCLHRIVIPIGKSPAVNGSQAIHHPHMYVSFLGGIEIIKPVVYCFTNII